MSIYQILGFIFLIPGVMIVFAARWLVGKYSLDSNINCDFESQMNEEEINKYKYNKAVINIKMAGMLVALPGFIFIIIGFR